MKIASKDIEKFIKNYDEQKKYKVIFLYGSDDSSVSFKFKRVLENFKNDGFLVRNIEQNELKQDKSILSQEFFSRSFFGEKTLITVKLLDRENDYTKCLEGLLGEKSVEESDNFILMTGGDLDKSSSLLKIVEKNDNVASVICYEEVDWNMPSFISAELKKYNFIFNSDVTNYLVNNIGKNKLIVENEIVKIDCYKGDNRKLTLEDVKKTTHDLASFDVGDLVNAFCSFNKKETFRLLDKFYREKNPLTILSRSLINYFLQLQKMRYCVDTEGYSIENIIEIERIFWKQKDIIKAHLNKWSLKNINIFLEKLMEFEKLKFNYDSQQLVENFLLKAICVLS
ncbi:MAG: DNA polymerase III subunit delta [Candidatus Peribacteria bacterium]|jgi:DNA polymerase-3 subunit delta|nr:DNA polymerase III subunit delta [Candidatus Peribacteria bacterium]